MNTVVVIWRANLTALRHASRIDGRLRFTVVVMLLLELLLGLWLGHQLVQRIEQWQVTRQIAVARGMWSLCLITWLTMGLISILEGISRGFGDDQSLLLFTQPIASAARFRALYGLFFVGRLWNWLLLEMGVTGVALVIALGWQGLVWLLLLQLGVACAVLCGLVLTLLVTLTILPHRTVCRLVLFALIVAMLAMLVLFWQVWRRLPDLNLSFLTPQPLFAILFCIVLLVLTLGPFAVAFGRLYRSAFLTMQSVDRSPRVLVLPGIAMLSRLAAQRRKLYGALLYKGLLSQSRNAFLWARIAVFLLLLVFNQWIESLFAPLHLPLRVFITCFAAGAALFIVLEQAPAAISGEGNRLTLYLTAPFSSANILRAKLVAWLSPILAVGLGIGLFLCWHDGLSLQESGFALVNIAVIITGCIVLPICGSAWDEDINQPVEGALQTILQEEAPVTPRRLALLNATIALFLASLWLVWQFVRY